jgi:hypothetical protein
MASPDLVNWRAVQTNNFEPGKQVLLPLNPGGTEFLKAFEWNNP